MEALELRDPAGAFRMLEEWLRERGFFGAGGEGLAAEVYLGYGLSQAIRQIWLGSLPASTRNGKHGRLSPARCRSAPI